PQMCAPPARRIPPERDLPAGVPGGGLIVREIRANSNDRPRPDELWRLASLGDGLEARGDPDQRRLAEGATHERDPDREPEREARRHVYRRVAGQRGGRRRPAEVVVAVQQVDPP